MFLRHLLQRSVTSGAWNLAHHQWQRNEATTWSLQGDMQDVLQAERVPALFVQQYSFRLQAPDCQCALPSGQAGKFPYHLLSTYTQNNAMPYQQSLILLFLHHVSTSCFLLLFLSSGHLTLSLTLFCGQINNVSYLSKLLFPILPHSASSFELLISSCNDPSSTKAAVKFH